MAVRAAPRTGWGRVTGSFGMAVLALILTACSGGSGQPGPNSTHTPPSTVDSTPGPITGPAPAVHFAAPQQQLFTPYDEDGILDADISKTQSGECWTSSIAMPISGVFRCMVANEIMDPCFAPAVDTDPLSVSCFTDPWTPGIRVTLTKALPTEDLILKDGNPWALELANGARCVVLTGALPVLGDYALQYKCDNDAVASLLTDDDGNISVMYGPAEGPLDPTAILTAWRGQSYRFGST